MNDIESALRTLVNDAVDDTLGPQSAAPKFNPPQRRTARPPWIMPAFAAASVAVVAGAATAVAVALHGSGSHHVPTLHPSTPKVSYHSLGGARIALPEKWAVRPYKAYLAPQAGLAPVVKQSWCLTPASLPTSTKPRACPVQLSTIRVLPGQQLIDPNTEEGLPGNPEYCLQGHQIGAHSERWGIRLFGGRDAEWRQVTIHCKAGGGVQFEQYVIDSLPSYILYAGKDSSTVHAALATMAKYSTMPRQTSRYRLNDVGVITSLKPGHGGATIALDRQVQRQDTFKDVTSGGRASYVVPTKVLARAGKVRKGMQVEIVTNGKAVTEVISTQ